MARTLSKNPRRDMSRLRRFAQNHLGVLYMDQIDEQGRVVRNKFLDTLDSYWDGTQYDDLMDWEDAVKQPDPYVPVRDRKPRIIYNLPKALVNKVASKLTGTAMFPNFIIEDDDDDTTFFRTVMKACKFRRAMIEPMKNMLKSGAVFVRYFLVNGTIQMEYAQSKYCYPVFDAVGELDSIEVKYVYDDPQDNDSQGKPKKKWYKLQLTKTADILFNNPEYRPGSTPQFAEVTRSDHGLGWVQGEWFVTHKDKFDFDGYSLYGDILDFCDDLNYSLSQTSQGVGYNQEPQLAINGVDEDELDSLIRSSTKAWNLGRDGKAAFVNSDMKGIEAAEKTRDHFRALLLDVVRVVLHDPDKMVSAAQSGKAMEMLNAPLVELVDELRQIIEPTLVNLLIKIAMTALHYNANGDGTVIETPPGYVPQSVDITVQWPPIFPPTLQDIQIAAQACSALAMGNIISRESLTRWMAQMIPSVDNVEEELQKIHEQPQMNPFGSSFMSGPPQENES